MGRRDFTCKCPRREERIRMGSDIWEGEEVMSDRRGRGCGRG